MSIIDFDDCFFSFHDSFNKLTTLEEIILSHCSNKFLIGYTESILIDDTHDVIKGFIAAGGIGVHHKDIGNTLMMLDKLLDRSPI